MNYKRFGFCETPTAEDMEIVIKRNMAVDMLRVYSISHALEYNRTVRYSPGWRSMREKVRSRIHKWDRYPNAIY